VKTYDLDWAESTTGIPSALIRTTAEWWGKAKTSFLLHARGIEHHSKGVENVSACINLVLATGRIGKPYCGYGTITGQGNGQGGREHGHKCDQLPGNRDIENPEHRRYIAEVWGIPESELPGKGLTAYEIVEAIHRGEIRGLLSICFNPLVSLPNNNMVREAFEKLEFYAYIDFFLSETARHADIVFPGSLHEEEEGTVTTAEGRVVRIRAAVDPLRKRAAIRKYSSIWPSVSGRANTSGLSKPKRFSMSSGWHHGAAQPIITGLPIQRSKKRWAFSGRVQISTIQARLACGKTGSFTRRTGKRTSNPCLIGIQEKLPMQTIRSF
jgi:anaerobic selenocysteine-containing dehydrogenase